MRRLLHYAVAALLAALLLPFPLTSRAVQASGGNATAQTVGIYRSACAVSLSGATLGTARFSADDQGGIPGGVEIRTGLTAGLTRTTYSVAILTGGCQLLTNAGTLVTDDSGRGDLDVHVSGTTIPAGTAIRVQLSTSGDTLTSPAVATATL
jgi:hypothetical protein